MTECSDYQKLRWAVDSHSVTVPSNLPDYIRVIITTDAHGRKRELLIPAALDLNRPKRPRTSFENWQVEAMEREFQKCAFITEEKRTNMAIQLGITETQVKVWFQNRRTKVRKGNSKPGDT